MSEKHYVEAENAERIWDWLQTRGGLAIWRSADLSDPGKSWTTPAQEEDGSPKAKQSWQMMNEPYRIITDPSEVEVHVPKEVDRFRVAIRQKGDWGLRFELTDGSSRRLRQRVRKADEKYCGDEELAWYAFDYECQEAVIFVPDRQVPIKEYIDELEQKRTGQPEPAGSRTAGGEHTESAAGDSGSES